MAEQCKIAHVCPKLQLSIIKRLVLFMDAVLTLIIDVNKCPLNITKSCKMLAQVDKERLCGFYLQSFAAVTEQHHG